MTGAAQAQAAGERQEEVLSAQQIVESLGEGIVLTGPDGAICFANQTFCDITGYAVDEVIGKNPRLLQSGRNSSAFYKRMWRTLEKSGRWQGEICNRRKNGQLYVEWLTITAIKDADGRVTHYLGVFSDISSRKRSEDRFRRVALRDNLTGLPTRPIFFQSLKLALARGRRARSPVALLFVDLDHVKDVNDRLGHAAGDILLREAARRLVSSVRSADTVARFGGDEFVIVLPDLKKAGDAVAAGEKILRAFRRPFAIGGVCVGVTASVGASLFPQDAGDMETLIHRADVAMYRAKTDGRDRLCLYENRRDDGTAQRLGLQVRGMWTHIQAKLARSPEGKTDDVR